MNKQRLRDRMRDAIRVRHYSLRTEEAYLGWVERFVVFNDGRPPARMGEAEVAAFLSYLATIQGHPSDSLDPDLNSDYLTKATLPSFWHPRMETDAPISSEGCRGPCQERAAASW